jgi:hypothetical protein
MSELRFFLLKRDEANERAWAQAEKLITSMAQCKDTICGAVPLHFIETCALYNANAILLAFRNSQCRPKRKCVRSKEKSEGCHEPSIPPVEVVKTKVKDEEETCAGFCLLQLRPRSSELYIDLMCARGAGSALVNVVKHLAKRWEYSHVTLSSLPAAMNFYRKLGFQNCELPMCVESPDIAMLAKSVQHKRFTSDQASEEDDEFRELLEELISRRLIRNKRCRKISSCSIDGYTMTFCLKQHCGPTCTKDKDNDDDSM